MTFPQGAAGDRRVRKQMMIKKEGYTAEESGEGGREAPKEAVC